MKRKVTVLLRAECEVEIEVETDLNRGPISITEEEGDAALKQAEVDPEWTVYRAFVVPERKP